MERVGTLGVLNPEAILTGREADRERLRTASRAAGGPEAHLRAEYPVLAQSCPPGLTEAALVVETTDLYADSEVRLALCAVCPPDGGACARATSILKPGYLPVWQGDRVVKARCERYREWKLCQRLAVSAVPERYRGKRLSEFEIETDPQQASFSAVSEFFASLRGGRQPWLVLSGPRASGKTHLACAMLRGIPKKIPDKRFWY